MVANMTRNEANKIARKCISAYGSLNDAIQDINILAQRQSGTPWQSDTMQVLEILRDVDKNGPNGPYGPIERIK